MYSVSAALPLARGISHYNKMTEPSDPKRPYFGAALAEDAFSLQGDPNVVADRLEALLRHEKVLQSEGWPKFEAFKRLAEVEMGKHDSNVARQGCRILFDRLAQASYSEKQAEFIERLKPFLYPPLEYARTIDLFFSVKMTGGSLLEALQTLKNHVRSFKRPKGTLADGCALFLLQFQAENDEQKDFFRQVLEFYNKEREQEPSDPVLAEQLSEKVRTMEASGFQASE